MLKSFSTAGPFSSALVLPLVPPPPPASRSTGCSGGDGGISSSVMTSHKPSISKTWEMEMHSRQALTSAPTAPGSAAVGPSLESTCALMTSRSRGRIAVTASVVIIAARGRPERGFTSLSLSLSSFPAP